MKLSSGFLILLIVLCPINLLSAQEKAISPLEQSMRIQNLVNVQDLIPSVWVELKYATTDNFTGVILYEGGLSNAYLHPIAAQKLKRAQEELQKLDPQLSLLIYDAARPLSVQRRMFEVVQGTPQQSYVANPDNTGLHNYGMAVDLTICKQNGFPLDMGTKFDFFGRAAAIRDEDGLIQEKRLTTKQVENRRLLRKVMTDAGFQTVQGEWWHFNAVSLDVARKNYKVIE